MELQNCMTDMLSTLASGFGDKALMLVDKDGTPAGHILGTEMVAAMEYEKTKRPSPLPDGYTQLLYLGSDSAAYIDTGIAGGVDTLEITCDFKWTTFVEYGAVYGNYVDEDHNVTRIILSSYSNRLYINTNSKASSGATQVYAGINIRHKIVSSFGIINSDGESQVALTSKGASNNGNICLFNRSITNPLTVSRNIGLMIYAFSVKDNGIKVLNLFPAKRNSDNEVGMYDLVSNTFLTNAGTGTFSYGEL